MTTKLQLAREIAFPVDAVTQTFLIVGKRGSGKSNTATRMVEQLHRAKVPFVVLDPADGWWGLKSNRDGTGPGLEGVYVFGGRHADLPLEAGNGALIAEVLCEHRLSMVLSVKHLSGRARSSFMVAFAQTLFQKWTGGPLHVILEEAHELAPQSSMNAREGEQEMLGAFKRLWKLGRADGIGGSAVTQRPASLSKDITTQSEILIAHRTIGPQDVAAIGEWVKYHGERKDVLAELPSLPTGQAFVWAPEFPEGKPLGLVRASILLRDTYDSASTPKVGEHRVEPKELAPVDLDRLRVKMAATIERAKDEDPKLLHQRIAELERDLRAKPSASMLDVVARQDVQAQIDEALYREAQRQERVRRVLQVAAGVARDHATALRHDLVAVAQNASALADELEGLANSEEFAAVKPVPPGQPEGFPFRKAAPLVLPTDHPRRVTHENRGTQAKPAFLEKAGDVSGPQHRMINALAQLRRVGVDPAPRNAVAALSNQSPRSSGWDKNCSTLRTAGYIAYPNADTMSLTDAGEAVAAPQNGRLTLAELHDSIRQLVSGPQWRMLDALIRVYPDAMDRGALAAASNQSSASSGWDKNLSTLRTLGFLDYPNASEAVATPLLFPKGLR